MSAGCHLKPATGWFAAGHEVYLAMRLLSDATFKLFVWLCLHAERSTGLVSWQPVEMAGELDKHPAEIRASLEELAARGIARLASHGAIEMLDPFWPYERARCPSVAVPASYIAEVKRIFLQPACVQSVFTTADERLAVQWQQKGVSLQCVERAIWLGCVRKYAALLKQGGGTPVTSLHYFTALLEEVKQSEVSEEYWRYVATKARSLEQQWRQLRAKQVNTVRRETK